MTQPNIVVAFTEKAATAIKRGDRGIIAMILKSDTTKGPFSYTKSSEIPATYDAALKKQIQLAFMGYDNPPRKVVGFIIPATDYTYSAATVTTGDNPTAEGWYEKNGNTYALSADTIAKSGVTYYEADYSAVTPEEGDNPAEEGWYVENDGAYELTVDTEVVEGTTYYALSYTAATVSYASNPATSGWYELISGVYTATMDTFPNEGKTYYAKSSEKVNNTDYSAAYNYLGGTLFQYLVVPTVSTDGMVSSVVSFVKEQRADHILIKAVLPDAAADCEGIINIGNSTFTEDDTVYTAEQYCSRIAGIICGTALTKSATFAPLGELTDCTRMTRSEADAAANAGKFIPLWDGSKVKMGRAVNSLVTTSATKNTQFQKIRIVEAMDMISDDIRTTCEDNYIGKYPNTYSNKLSLIAAIGAYFAGLALDSVISTWSIDIDVEANELYLKSHGVDTSEMTQQEIREANTGSNVFLVAKLSMVDAIEDVTLNIAI